MVPTTPRQPKLYDRPAQYRICVQGRVDPSWMDSLEGMAVYKGTSQAGEPYSILEGELSDQAALAGVMNTLYELHLTVLTVQRMGD